MARRARPRFVRLVDRMDVDRSEATQLIQAGRVMVNGIITANPHTLVAIDASVSVLADRTLRGTVKLRAALSSFDAHVTGQTCLDVGAAAGGFTTALLDAGAAKVYAVDTGYGQLVGRLRQDPRVVNLERTNLRDLTTALIRERVGLVCVDVSYVALATALPQLQRLDWAPSAEMVALVKPTFELSGSGLLADDDSVAKAEASAKAAAESCGWSVLSSIPAPATGRRGAREVFIFCRRQSG